MFNSIRGVLTDVKETASAMKIHVFTSSVEWEINMPLTSHAMKDKIKSEVRIFTYLYVSENEMSLYGFESENEREVFTLLLKVNGIGVKAALKILSSVEAAELLAVIESEDVKKLEKIKGVGKKTAMNIIFALKGKIALASEKTAASPYEGGKWQAVISSLCEMGFEAEKVRKETDRLSLLKEKEADFQKLSEREKEDALFKSVLMELSTK